MKVSVKNTPVVANILNALDKARKRAKSNTKENKNFQLSPSVYISILLKYIRFRNLVSRDSEKLFIYQNGVYSPAMYYLDDIIELTAPTDMGVGYRNFKDIYISIRSRVPRISAEEASSVGYIIPCNNCLYNRQTGQTMPFSPNYFFQTKLQTDYPNDVGRLGKIKIKSIFKGLSAKQLGLSTNQLNMPIKSFINQFLDNISDHDADTKTQIMQEFLDALEPNYTRNKAVINMGLKGNNGKSNLTHAMVDVIGEDRVSALKINELSDKFAFASIVGAVANISDDLGDQLYIKDDSNLKSITTGGVVTIQAKYQNPYSDSFKIAIIQNTNKFPQFQGKGDFIKRRLQFVPFEHQFSPDEPGYVPNNTMLLILNSRPVRECLLYKIVHQPLFIRYHQSAKSKKLCNKCMMKNDPVAQFVSVFKHDFSGDRIPRLTLYKAFQNYAGSHGFKKMSSTSFYSRFEEVMPTAAVKRARYNEQQAQDVFDIIKDVEDKNLYDNPVRTNSTYRSYVWTHPFVHMSSKDSIDDIKQKILIKYLHAPSNNQTDVIKEIDKYLIKYWTKPGMDKVYYWFNHLIGVNKKTTQMHVQQRSLN